MLTLWYLARADRYIVLRGRMTGRRNANSFFNDDESSFLLLTEMVNDEDDPENC
jgi:hypothetical protein